MEFLSGIAEFLLQALILLAVFLLAVAGLFALSARKKGSEEGFVEARLLNDRLESYREAVQGLTEPEPLAKQREKERKKNKKRELKEAKRALKGSSSEESPTARPRLFVLDFDGDMQASQVANLREEISAILPIADKQDEVLVRLESGGGVVHGYGLAASQLVRIKNAGIQLTVSVDKVAASGGYMMACVADRIIAAPFAILGSIGVVAQLPNFNRLLKKHDIDIELHTAGEFKRTLTLFGENTDKGREKFQSDIEDIHLLFKEFVANNRPQLEIEEVATGEYWFGQRALEKQLADSLSTSDEYLLGRVDDWDLVEVRYRVKRGWQERLGLAAESAVERGLRKILQSERDSRFL